MGPTIILNPYANRWRAADQAQAIEDACRALGLDFKLLTTTRPGEATALAATAAADPACSAVVAAGGDGTIDEVFNGLMSLGVPAVKPFGVVPIGTANDFARMAGLPLDLAESLKVIAAGKTRQIDGGRVNDRYFINNSAAAMEPMVTLENVRMTRLQGEVRYIVALLRALAHLKPWTMQIRWDDGRYDGPVYLLSVCNSPRTGGFMMAPGAVLDDGLFDMVLVPQVPMTTVLKILVMLMRGDHVNHPAVTFCRAARIEVHSQPGTPVHSDGEVFTESAEEVRFEVLPGQVSLLVP